MSLGKKRIWQDWEIKYLENNFYSSTNKQLSVALNIKLTALRTKCYEMGLKRMDLEYWTDEQQQYLVDNYKKCGDKELAEIFNKKWKKKKGWSLKHIEKKRKYLKLKRTAAELRSIKDKAIAKGVYRNGLVKTWDKLGRSPEGTIHFHKHSTGYRFPVIKVNGRFVQWARHTWIKNYGAIPKQMKVAFKDGNTRNMVLENLELVTCAEMARRNAKISCIGLSDNYIIGMMTPNNPGIRPVLKNYPGLINLKRKSLILNRKINEQTTN